METNLGDLFEEYVNKFEDLLKIIPEIQTSYEYEIKFNTIFKEFGRSIYQSMVGNVPKSKYTNTGFLSL